MKNNELTPEQKFAYHRKYGRMPPETVKIRKGKSTHAVVMQGNRELTGPLPWALAQYRKKKFENQGLLNLKLKGVKV